ncbi:MAG: fumarate reductase subunit C [Deltaproteobacteria bacterium]|nr:fumarate reductase subunit C [Deltaproteobacteria bacterium]MBW2399574.1 fumarate reductase subunit C [Deltaproteobacteria bacterium]MBW2666248.1 fumarate reductase subunit C [Deltaproteobacteria bacterium]
MSRKPYVRTISNTWWLEKPEYTLYMLRELTSVFVGGYAVVMLVGLKRLSEGQAAYEGFLAALTSPLAIALHVLALLFAVLHSATFFFAAPAALPLQIGEKKVSPGIVAGAHYAAWAVVSLAVFVLVVWR